MNNIKTFENFRNEKLDQELNEGLWDALKNVWKFFKGVNKKLQDSLGNFTKKLQISKDWNNTLSIFNSDIIQPYSKYFEDGMKNATTIDQIRKLNYEVHSQTFPALSEMKLMYGLDPSKLFQDPSISIMYKYENTELFMKNLPTHVNALVRNSAIKVKYPVEEINKSEDKYKDFTQDPPVNQPANQQPANQQQSNQQQSNNAIRGNSTEKYIMSYNDFNKIFEANPNQQPNNQQPNNNLLDKLKTENINTLKNSFYGMLQKKLKAFKPTLIPNTNSGTTTPVDDKSTQTIISKMKASGPNVKGKEVLLNTIFNDKTTTDQLNKTRDVVTPIFKINKPEKTIGKF